MHGFSAGHKTLAIAALYRRGWPRPDRTIMLVLTVGPGHAERLAAQLSSLLPEDEVLLFPTREIWPHEELHVPEEITSARLAVLALRARDVPVEFLVFDDEGHGIVRLANKQVAYPAIVAFLQQYL